MNSVVLIKIRNYEKFMDKTKYTGFRINDVYVWVYERFCRN